MCFFSWSADALPPRHVAHAVDTLALMGDGVPLVDGPKTPPQERGFSPDRAGAAYTSRRCKKNAT